MSGTKRLAAAIACAALVVSTVWGFVLLGPRWPGSTVVMQLQLGSSGGRLIDGSASWGEVAETALAQWNEQISELKFRVVRDSTAAIREGDGANNVFFAADVFGSSFGSAVAITTTWRRGDRRTEADVIFNTRFDWNSYRGSLRRASGGGTLYDFRRVALHEFGHVLGLDHPDEFGQNVRAIMNSRVSSLDELQDDDIRGAQSLYGVGRASALAFVTRPGVSPFTTNRSRIVVRGRAPSSDVRAVFLRSSRIKGQTFRASGTTNWRKSIRLRSGANRITVLVRTSSGQVEKAAVFRIRRR